MDRNTAQKQGVETSSPVAAASKCEVGKLAVADANGFVKNGLTALNLTCLGMFTKAADNSAGANGDLDADIMRNRAFKFDNSGGDAIGQAGLGKDCYIEDSETVAATDGVGTRSVCGKVIQIDADGVWVYIG